jgi:anaerobic selenocysteine-containing dehydrogenase
MTTPEDVQTHYRTSNLCEAICGIEIKVAGERIVSIRGDKDDPFSRGYICPKAAALQDLHEDKDRLRHPVRKTKSGFERIGWDEAFDEVADRIKAIQAQHGKNAVGLYVGNPTVHNYGSILFGLPFIRSLRTRNRFSATSADQLPHHLASLLMFGHQLLLPIPDVDRTDFMLILGGNPVVSNGSLMTAPGIGHRLKAIGERGGKVVVVDPRRTETAELADQHHFIRPGADVLLMLGLLHTIFAEGLAAPGRLAGFTDGVEALRQSVQAFPPERVAEAAGIDAGSIRALARSFAGAKSAVCYGRMGVSTQTFGGVTQWLINALNLVTGNLDRPGGAMFTRPAFDIVALGARGGQKGHFDRGRSRVRKLPEFSGEYPVATLAEEILTEGPGQIRALITSAGNPVLSTPNGRQLERALSGLEFMASIDFYINETTRHAHIILPPTAALEHDNYDLVFHALAVRNTAKYSPALFKPAEDARHDWEIFLELSTRLDARNKAGPLSPLIGRARRALFRTLTPKRLLDLGLRLGPYGSRLKLGGPGLSVRKLEAEVHGVDLGALTPCLPARLFTKDRRIKLAPEPFLRDLSRVEETWFAPSEARAEREEGSAFDLELIGRRHLRSNNSWMHNSLRLVKGPERCTLLMHPEDAARRSLAPDQQVRVSSRVGSIELKVEVTDEMMPGVVSIPHGWGHDRPGIQVETAKQHAGASINDLTDDLALDALSGNAAFSGVRVRVEPREAPAAGEP